MKSCSKCEVSQPTSEFHRDRSSSDGRVGHCKTCAKAITAARADYMAEYHAKNRGRKYGLSPAEYAALEDASGGVCALCSRPPTGKRDRLVVDHDHATNRVRELLCHQCNVGIGLLGDDPDVMMRAAIYVRKHQAA